MMLKHSLLALALSGLTACALPAQHVGVRTVVASRLYLPSPAVPALAELDVVRANGLFGGGCASEISIDGHVAVQLQQGERVALHLASGSHLIDVRQFGACSQRHQQLQAQFQPAQTRHLQIGSHGKSLAWQPEKPL